MTSDMCVSRGVWSTVEHERFLEAVARYPAGPWNLITAHIGTRSAKQVQTHAQKFQHKLLRHQRGLRKWKTTSKRPEHRIDATVIGHLLRPTNYMKEERQLQSIQPWAQQPHKLCWMEVGDSQSESVDWSESARSMIEPIPFGRAIMASLNDDQELDDIREALEIILS